jgi:alpha-ribazole phosphatase
MSLFLVRHTAVAVDKGVCYGISDVPLAGTFEDTAKLLLQNLPPAPWHVISSPSTRCRKLAESFGPFTTIDGRLRELDFGEWEMRRWDDIPRAEIDLWSADFVHRAPPGGESFAALADRAEACIADISEKSSSENVLVVTHAGVIRALLASRRKIPLREAFGLPVDFGSIHLLPTKRPTATTSSTQFAPP